MQPRTNISQTVELPQGIEHYQTSCHAESWAVYDALTAEDGWERKDAGNVGNPEARWKEATIRGHLIIVHEPREPRPECPDCHGGRHNPSPRHDPQLEVDCPRCEGEGIEDYRDDRKLAM